MGSRTELCCAASLTVHFEERDAGHLADFVASDALVGAGVFWEGLHDGQCVESLCGGGHLEVLGGFHQLVVAVPGHHGRCSGRGTVLVRVKLCAATNIAKQRVRKKGGENGAESIATQSTRVGGGE